MSNYLLIPRDLPALSTTTTSTSSTSTSNSASTTSSSETYSSTLTSSQNSTTAGNSTLTATYTTPVITPPSTEGNPNIWYSNKAPGTVFIAVGSVAGAILLAVLLWYLLTTWVSYRQAKQMRDYNNMERQFQNPFLDDTEYKGGLFFKDDEDRTSSSDDYPIQSVSDNVTSLGQNKRASHSMIRLLGGSTEDLIRSQPHLVDNSLSNTPVEMTNAINQTGMERRSLYISPTLEVMNQQRKSALFNNLNQSVASLPASDGEEISPALTPQKLNKPGRTVSPERRSKHQSKKSGLNKVVNASTAELANVDESTPKTRKNGHRRTKTPSMFLDDMLES